MVNENILLYLVNKLYNSNYNEVIKKSNLSDITYEGKEEIIDYIINVDSPKNVNFEALKQLYINDAANYFNLIMNIKENQVIFNLNLNNNLDK